MTVESELTECKAHVARLDSELLNLRQQHARDQKESLEHVRKACSERDEARVESANAEADRLQARRALTETEKDLAVSLSIQTQLRKELDKANVECDTLLESAHFLLDALEKRRTDDDKALCLWCGAITLRADIASHVKGCDKNPLIAELATARAQVLQSDRDIATAIERARVAELAASGWSVRAKHLRESGELGQPFSANTVDWGELARLAYQDAKGLLEASGSTALVGREYMSGLLQCLADALHWMHGNVTLATHMGKTHTAALTEQVGMLTAKRDEALARLKGQDDFIRTITLERDHAQQVEVPHYCQERDDALAKLKESEEFHAGAPSLTEYGHLCDGIQLYRVISSMAPTTCEVEAAQEDANRWEHEHGKRLVPSEP